MKTDYCFIPVRHQNQLLDSQICRLLSFSLLYICVNHLLHWHVLRITETVEYYFHFLYYMYHWKCVTESCDTFCRHTSPDYYNTMIYFVLQIRLWLFGYHANIKKAVLVPRLFFRIRYEDACFSWSRNWREN